MKPTGGGEPGGGGEPDWGTVTGPLEALLLMATEPLSTAELAQALDVPKPVVWAALESLRTSYDDTGRGFELREVGQGWRYYTRPEHHDVIARWVLEGQHARLSQAALETLAVVAYVQPVSRSRVSAVRAVNVDGVVRTLVSRGLIQEAGSDPETGAMLFITTDFFLERMGLTSLEQLAPLAPHLPEASQLEAELAALADGTPASASAILGGDDEREDLEMSKDLLPEQPDQTPRDVAPSAKEVREASTIPDKDQLERIENPDPEPDPA